MEASHMLISQEVEKINDLIDLIRIVDAGASLNPVVVGPDEVDWSRVSGTRDYTAKVLERLEDALSVLPPEVAEAVGFDVSSERIFEDYLVIASFSPNPLDFDSFSSALISDREFFLRWAGRTILESANRYERLRGLHSRIYKLLSYLEDRERVPIDMRDFVQVPEIFRSSVAYVDSTLVLVPDELTNALVGTDLSKLKRCPVCRRAFWQSRKDQKGCRRACAHVLRTRKWRDKTTAEQRSKYKANRVLKEMKKERRKR